MSIEDGVIGNTFRSAWGQTIPTTKQLLINGVNVGVPMILDDDFEFRIQNEFSTLEDLIDKSRMLNKIKGFLETGAQLLAIAKDQPITARVTQYSIPIWKDTSPIQFSMNVSFFWDSIPGVTPSGKLYVYNPIKTLCSLGLPVEAGTENVLGLGSVTVIKSPLPSIAAMSGGAGGYLMKIGRFSVSNVIIESADPTFSTETDSNGYPIFGTVSLTCRTIQSATVNKLNGVFSG